MGGSTCVHEGKVVLVYEFFNFDASLVCADASPEGIVGIKISDYEGLALNFKYFLVIFDVF